MAGIKGSVLRVTWDILKQPIARQRELADEVMETAFQLLILGFPDLFQGCDLLTGYNVPQRGGLCQPHQADALVFWGTGASYT